MGRKLLVLLGAVMLSMFWIGIDMGSRWTPLQAHYFPVYVSSIAHGGKGRYVLLFVKYHNGSRMALNKDVVISRANLQSGQVGLFTLSDEARKTGGTALEWKFLPDLDNATAAEWLRQANL